MSADRFPPVERATYPGLDARITILRLGTVVDAVHVRTARFDVLVDTLDTPQACAAALRLLEDGNGSRPLIVVNSHMDWDHFWGNAAVLDRTAAIIAHDRAHARIADPSTHAVLAQMAGADPRYRSVELVGPTMTFGDTARLDGGDLTLELIHTPGHTPDHVAVWIPELRTCLAVDAVEDPIPGVWSDDPADLHALMASLHRIRALDAEHVVLAHGQTASPDIVDRNLAYFAALEERVRKLAPATSVAGTSDIPEGLHLRDLVRLPAAMNEGDIAFYEACHLTNLQATMRSIETGHG